MELELIFSILSTTAAAVAMLVLKTLIDKRKASIDNKEVADDVEAVISKLIPESSGDDDVLAMMIKNVGELREYYVINKQQARSSFSAALFISFLGFVLFASGVVISFTGTDSVIQYSTVGGAIVEIVAGLFFWLYSKATTQINIFHKSLQDTEKFLTAIQLVDKMSQKEKDEAYKLIITKVLEINVNNSKE